MMHLQAASIERFVYAGADELNPIEVEHLLSCPQCAAQLADEARVAESMRRSANELDALPERRQNGFLLVTAMVLAVVLCGARLWPSPSAAAPPPAVDAGPAETAGPIAD